MVALIALFVPQFTTFISVIGGGTFALEGFFFPMCLYYYKLSAQEKYLIHSFYIERIKKSFSGVCKRPDC